VERESARARERELEQEKAKELNNCTPRRVYRGGLDCHVGSSSHVTHMGMIRSAAKAGESRGRLDRSARLDRPLSSTRNETFGFLGWITSSVMYCLFIVWACTPDALLHFHGVTWYPDKYWACAVPVWACVTLVAAFFMYGALNGVHGERLLAKKREETLARGW